MSQPLLTLAQAQALLPGATLVGAGDVAFTRVHSDTRSLQPGDLFVALRGERFDAHDFLPQAAAAGAVAALAERGLGADSLLPHRIKFQKFSLGVRATPCPWWR